MIVVVGGSGTLGSGVVADLQARGEPVRVLVRDVARARQVLGPEVDLVPGDVRRPDTLTAAFTGATVVVSAMHGLLGGRGAGPEDVDRVGNGHLVRAAADVRARVVLVSVLGAVPDSPLELIRAKAAAEHDLRARTGDWTIVRAGPFLETWLHVLAQTAGASGRPLVFGSGTRPIPFVSAIDVAAVVGLAATSTALLGQVAEVGGAPLTMNELAAAGQRAGRWRGDPRHVPRAVLRTLALMSRPISQRTSRQNRMALDMDRVDLGPGDPHLRARLGLQPATTLADLLAEPDRPRVSGG